MRSSTPEDRSGPRLMHARLLGARLYLHTYVRLIVAGTIVIGAFFARYIVGIENLDVPALTGLGLGIAAYNAAAYALTRQHRDLDPSTVEYRRLVIIMYGAIVLDFLALTVAVWLVGGCRSPFLTFYLLHVTLACLLLRRSAAILLTGFAFLLILLLVATEWFDVFPPRQPAGAIGGTGLLDGRYAITILAVYGMLLGITAFLLLGLTTGLREGEQRLRALNERLAKLSEMQRNFLHVTLHNLQSPIGAVTMFLDNMRSGLGGPVTPKQEEWLDRSRSRLDGLAGFLHDLQILARLEAGDIDAEASDVDLRAMLVSLFEEYRELAQERGHTLSLEVPDALPCTRGIERLLREAVINYLTNAIKYTPADGRIVIRAAGDDGSVRIEVVDDGIGIAPADRDRLFREFVRIRRPDADVPAAAGSGIGLSIVRRIIEAHGGSVDVASALNEGSTFIIELPAAR